MQHTRLPWHVNAVADGRIIGDETARSETHRPSYHLAGANASVATIYRPTDAAFIRRACNCHIDLLSALDAMLQAYAPHADETARIGGEDSLHSAVRAARAAITKATT